MTKKSPAPPTPYTLLKRDHRVLLNKQKRWASEMVMLKTRLKEVEAKIKPLQEHYWNSLAEAGADKLPACKEAIKLGGT